jgi:hypothetical protein
MFRAQQIKNEEENRDRAKFCALSEIPASKLK